MPTWRLHLLYIGHGTGTTYSSQERKEGEYKGRERRENTREWLDRRKGRRDGEKGARKMSGWLVSQKKEGLVGS